MKKLVASLTVLLLALNMFAQAGSLESPEVLEVEQVIDEEFKTDAGKSKVYELSANLTSEQRQYLYDENEKSRVGPFFANAFLGFGIGSFIQGDTKAGKTQLFMDLGGIGALVAGYALVAASYYEDDKIIPYRQYDSYTNTYETRYYFDYENKIDSGKYIAGCACVGLGAGLVTAAAIIGYIRPWVYGANYNESLRKALRIDDSKLSVKPQFAPIIDPFNKKYGLVTKIEL